MPVIVDCAVYEQGVRVATKPEVDGIRAHLNDDRAFMWVGLVEPTAEEFDVVRREFDLHELAVEDAVKAHQRPKLEHYGDSLFVVLKTVQYVDSEEVVEIGEVMLFIGRDFLVSVRHGEGGGLGRLRARRSSSVLSCSPRDRARRCTQSSTGSSTATSLRSWQSRRDVAEVEADVFSDGRANPVERIYKLRREVLEFHSAIAPLSDVLDALQSEPLIAESTHDYLRDVADHAARADENVNGIRDLLGGILQANLTQVSVRQNEDMRKISAWVAIIAVPTMIAGIYGMNFEHMPELEWRFGYPAVLLVIAAACSYLYIRFRRSGWL